ncbi:hypothetical protein MXB_5236, partial [Myxobolus squamalis]
LRCEDIDEKKTNKKEYNICLQLDGFEKDQIEVRINSKNVLCIHAKREEIVKDGKNLFEIIRKYEISSEYNPDTIECELKRGSLIVTVKKYQKKPHVPSSKKESEIKTSSHRICVSLDIGDFKKEDIIIKSENGNLIIKGSSCNRRTGNNCKNVTVKRKFKRVYYIGCDLDIDKIQSKVVNGKLYIELPKLKGLAKGIKMK